MIKINKKGMSLALPLIIIIFTFITTSIVLMYSTNVITYRKINNSCSYEMDITIQTYNLISEMLIEYASGSTQSTNQDIETTDFVWNSSGNQLYGTIKLLDCQIEFVLLVNSDLSYTTKKWVRITL